MYISVCIHIQEVSMYMSTLGLLPQAPSQSRVSATLARSAWRLGLSVIHKEALAAVEPQAFSKRVVVCRWGTLRAILGPYGRLLRLRGSLLYGLRACWEIGKI